MTFGNENIVIIFDLVENIIINFLDDQRVYITYIIYNIDKKFTNNLDENKLFLLQLKHTIFSYVITTSDLTLISI